MSTTPRARRTLFEVERERRSRIWLLFALLLAMVFVTAWVACLIVAGFVALLLEDLGIVAWLFTPRGAGLVLAAALAFSLLQWGLARIGPRDRLLKAMHCRPLDRGDRYHERLRNIVEEMRLATGAPRVECVTVATVGLNAFAFSDLRGGGVIGVTEGALARLSRQQLEAVVAHELAHVLSGSCVTATVACLLIGIYSALDDSFEEVMDASEGMDDARGSDSAGALSAPLGLLRLASHVLSMSLSREREREADLAAARYTRDPLSLAEALRVISRHPGGAGYIPAELAPLCIRATDGGSLSRASWLDTHPPLQERIDMLLAIAATSPAEFERQAAQASEDFSAREHWAPVPAAAAGAAGQTVGATDRPTAVADRTTAVADRPAGATTVGAVPSGSPPSSPPVAGPVSAAGMTCPSCGSGLSEAPYESVSILVCQACGGRLVTTGQVHKILARREAAFDEQQVHLADLLAASGDRLRRAARLDRGQSGVPLAYCPRCAQPMIRRHYDYTYAVEIDYCVTCDVLWFEKNELEALQILIERQTG